MKQNPSKIKIGLIIAVGMLLAVRLSTNAVRLWKAGERVKEVQAEVDQAEAENKRLKAKLSEVQTPEFVEKEARERLGYGKEGETIVVVPEQAQIQNSDNKSSNEAEPNWKKWWRLYVGL
jgi:cell division protein FtsB